MGRYLKIKTKVKKVLDLSEEQYQSNVLEFSYAFLEHKNYTKSIIDTLHQTQGYWIWWRNQFGIADMMFLNLYSVFDWHSNSLRLLRSQYWSCHIGIKAYPSRLIEKIDKQNSLTKKLKRYEKR